MKDWHHVHKTHMEKFRRSVVQAKKSKRTQPLAYSEDAFNSYLRWFQRSTRLEIMPPAYEPGILDVPLVFDDVVEEQYNLRMKDARHTNFAPFLNFAVMCDFVRFKSF